MLDSPQSNPRVKIHFLSSTLKQGGGGGGGEESLIEVELWNLPKIIFDDCRSQGERSRDGTVVRALASHQCSPGSILALGVIDGLSLLLVLVVAWEVFLRVLRFSPFLKKKQRLQIPNLSGLLSSTLSRTSSSGNCASTPSVIGIK